MSRGKVYSISEDALMIQGIVARVIGQNYQNHRLAYIWKDGDTPDTKGRPTTVYVCKCQEGFSRTGYNEHIRDSYKEVN